MKIKQIAFITLLLLGTVMHLFAASGEFKSVTGKVEVMISGGTWQTAVAGMAIPEGASISTGFRSSAVIILGSSLMEIEALTRMTLDELAQSGDTQTTDVFLRVGRVNAEVNASSNLKHDFTLRSPVATAAVRGTKFSFNGYELEVNEGIVQYFNRIGQSVNVYAGATSTVAGLSAPASSNVNNSKDYSVNTSVTDGISEIGTPAGNTGSEAIGSIHVTVELE